MVTVQISKQKISFHIYNGILLRHKKEKKLTVPFAELWMDLETVLQSKVNQKEKNKYNTAYMWNLEK